METEEIRSELERYVRERFAVPADDAEFSREVDLFNYGYIDSFGAVDLTQFIESHFSIALTEADWVSHPLSTINEIADFTHARRSGQK